jgi:hypothetical protein
MNSSDQLYINAFMLYCPTIYAENIWLVRENGVTGLSREPELRRMVSAATRHPGQEGRRGGGGITGLW